MKRILVTGANSYIGNALVLALLNLKRRFIVRAAARSGEVLNAKCIETVRFGSLEDTPDYQKDFADCDILIHCATRGPIRNEEEWPAGESLRRINVLGTVHVAREAFRAGVKRFVFLSSLEVNGSETPDGKKFFADSLPRPKSILGRQMLEAEKALRRVGDETGMEVVIVRPAMVYGPACHNLFGFAGVLTKYCIPLPLLCCSHNQRSLVSIDNLTDFLTVAATHPKAANDIFLVSDGHDLSTLEIFRLLAKTDHRPSVLWPFPPLFLRLFNSYIGRQSWENFLFKNQVADISKNKMLLEWVPPMSVEQSFRRFWDEPQVAGRENSPK